jgi:hypothetical protein
MIPGEYVGAKVGRDHNFSFEVYQWCSLDYSCFKVWVIVCNAPLNLASCVLEITSKAIGNTSICVSSAKISSRNAHSSCGSLSFGRRERALAMILRLMGR